MESTITTNVLKKTLRPRLSAKSHALTRSATLMPCGRFITGVFSMASNGYTKRYVLSAIKQSVLIMGGVLGVVTALGIIWFFLTVVR